MTIHYTIIALLALSLSGCGDNPQDKAAKSLQQSLNQSLELARRHGDYQKARQQLSAAISRVSAENPLRNTSLLAAANLSIHSANQQIAQLTDAPRAVNKAIEQIDRILPDLIDTEHRIQALNNLYQASEKEIADLEAIIQGTPDRPGLARKLSDYRQQLTELNSQISRLEAQAQQFSQTVDQKQNKADEYFTQAARPGLSTERQVHLRQMGLEIMKERKDSLFELQSLKDKISLIEQEARLVQPMITRLENDIRDIRSRIENVTQARQQSELARQITDARSTRNTLIEKLKNRTANLNETFDAYTARVERINTDFTDALEDYRKIRSRDLRDAAQTHQAQALYNQALFLSGVTDFTQVTAGRVKAKSLKLSEPAERIIADAGDQIEQKAQDCREKTQKAYQAAFDLYNELNQAMSGTASQIDCSVAKGFILTAAAMRDFNNRYESFAYDQAIQARIEQAVEQAKQCDPRFETSTPGRFLSGSLEFQPVLDVDTNTYFDQKREEYQQKFSRLAQLEFEQRKTEAQKLLEELRQLRRIDPEAYDNNMGPLESQLETEIAKEQDDQAGQSGSAFGGGFGPAPAGGEPNGF